MRQEINARYRIRLRRRKLIRIYASGRGVADDAQILTLI
jgi:hypothetical protein